MFSPTAQDVLVYLVGDSAVHLCVEGVACVSVQELGRSVREALHIPDSAMDAFAFWLCSPLLGNDRSLSLYAPPPSSSPSPLTTVRHMLLF